MTNEGDDFSSNYSSNTASDDDMEITNAPPTNISSMPEPPVVDLRGSDLFGCFVALICLVASRSANSPYINTALPSTKTHYANLQSRDLLKLSPSKKP
ncbi:hypothetical protein L6452_13865 [Arctium lappa]|uniref:Uncharacterized protein n=1 Tax=Arctium lappa TaxID=4217 RepID=A0ACB9CJT7_ARCLA|nr:hypothetical protein L6452_13865 [Arctium lappa]